MTISGVDQRLIDFVIVKPIFGVPLEFYYAILIATVIWYLFEFTAIGRRILLVGRGREVARLSASTPITSAGVALSLRQLWAHLRAYSTRAPRAPPIRSQAPPTCFRHSRRPFSGRPASSRDASIRGDQPWRFTSW